MFNSFLKKCAGARAGAKMACRCVRRTFRICVRCACGSNIYTVP